jgi:hypothetical protein
VGAACCAPTPQILLSQNDWNGYGTAFSNWFSPWAWDAQRHTYRATSPQTLDGYAPVRNMPIRLRNRVSLSIKPLNCQGGCGGTGFCPPARGGSPEGGSCPIPLVPFAIFIPTHQKSFSERRSPYLSQSTKIFNQLQTKQNEEPLTVLISAKASH